MTTRPNIVLLMSDQHRYDVMGCAGDPVVRTPNMDRLAVEGFYLRRSVCVAPLCMPSRASIITGRYPHNHGVIGNVGMILPQERTFMQCLQSAGYYTAVVGKMHFFTLPRGGDLREMMQVTASFGFHDVYETLGRTAARYSSDPHTGYLDERGLLQRLREDHSYRTQQPIYYATPSVLPEEDFLDTHIGRKSVEWIQRYDRSQPFFLWTSWAGPHDPWDAPGKYGSMYDPADMPASVVDDLSAKPDIQQKRAERQHMHTCTEQDIRKARAQYYGLVTLIDDQIGQILTALEERGWLNNTIIVYVSDHGEMMGDHGLFLKEQFYEPSVRVPLIVRYPPMFPRSTKCDALVELIDLMPTFLELAGADIPEVCLGRSLLSVLKGGSHEHREAVFSELGRTKMVRTERYKYTYMPGKGSLELYDLYADPQEVTNLLGCAEYIDVQREMERRLLDWLISTERHLNSKGTVREHRLQ